MKLLNHKLCMFFSLLLLIVSCNSFKEDFDVLDLKKWKKVTFGFPENGCNMVPENSSVSGSILELKVTENFDTNMGPLPYNGAEVASNEFYSYGFYTVRMRSQIADGSVSSFFLINKWEETNWEHREIDIEFTGKDTRSVQFTVHHYANGGKEHRSHTYVYPLDFDAAESFHDYSILWTKDSISWFVNYKLAYTEKRLVPNEPLQIRINHWIAAPSQNWAREWLGPVNRDKLPSKAYYDWITYKPLKQNAY